MHGEWYLPFLHSGSHCKMPPTSKHFREMRRGVLLGGCPPGSPPLSPTLPAAGLLPHSQPECSPSIVPHCGTAPPPLLPHPRPPQPSPPAISKSRPPHSPLGNRERERSPRSRLLNLDPHQYSNPHPPRDAGAQEGVVSDTLGWVNSTPPTPQHTQTHALRPRLHVKVSCSPHPPRMPPPALSYSCTRRDPSPGLWPLAVASPEQKPEREEDRSTPGCRTSPEATLPKPHRPFNFGVWVTTGLPPPSRPPPHLSPGLGPSHEPHPLPFLHSAQQRDRYSVWLPWPGLPQSL